MSVKTVSYEVNMTGITPASIQQGGVQGDHNATSLSFHIDDVLYGELQMHATDGKKLVYRFDGYDSVGGFDSTVPQVLTEQCVGYGLENWLTRHGGRITVYLVFSVIDENADPATELELYCFPAVLQLKDKPEAANISGENYESLSSLATIARESANIAVDSKEIAVDAKEKTEQAKAQLEGGTRWVFDGGGATGKSYLSLVTDDAMSDTSVNPVQNRVVKAAVDSTREAALTAAQTAKEEAVAESDAAFEGNFKKIAADYIVEQGEYNPRLYSSNGNDTGSVSNSLWTYQKWASGRISIDGGIYIAAEKGRTNFGEGYVTAFAHAYGYPCEMTKEPHVTVGLGTCADNGFFWPVVRQWAGSLRKQTPVYAVCSGSAYGGDGTGGYHICVHVEGTWK